jgi:hypothetical protein
MNLMLATVRAILFKLNTLGDRLLVLRAGVVLSLTLSALKSDDIARHRF